MDKEQEIFNHFVHNQQYYKGLLKPLRDETGQIIINDDQLNKEVLNTARWVVACHLCLEMKLPLDPVMDFLYNVKVKELLK